MRQRLLFLLFASLPLATAVSAQSNPYGPPVSVPIQFSANFAELRPNHFHSGIDIKMAAYAVSKRGVKATADGYVSRIAVSSGGFGNAVYIYHPSLGTTSVYAHLDSFNSEIARYTEAQQKEKKQFGVSLFPAANELPVKKGEVIGIAGNSGSSGGIHLHYEVRGKGEEPMNVVKKGYVTAADTIAPTIVSVSAVRVDTVLGVPLFTTTARYPATKGTDGRYKISGKVAIEGTTYLIIEYTDRKNGVENKFGIYSLDAKLRGETFFSFKLDRVNFGNTRYINTLSEYRANTASSYSVARLYRSNNNKLDIYENVKESGLIRPASINDGDEVSITLADDSGNTSVIAFALTLKPLERVNIRNLTDSSYVVRWNERTVVESGKAKLTVPANALYDSDIIEFYTSEYKSGISQTAHLEKLNIPAQSGMTLRIEPDSLDPSLYGKALIGRRDKEGRWSSAGGKWNAAGVETAITDNGIYTIVTDTVAPVIKPKQKGGAEIAGDRISFIITDNLSGISSYNGYIDGEWAIFGFDAKTSTLEHRIKRDGAKKQRQVRIEVADGKGNKQTYRTHYFW